MEDLKELIPNEYICWCFLERTRLSFDWWFETIMKQQDEGSREIRDME